MKRKIFSITIALVLLTGLCLIPAVPAAGADGYDSSLTLDNKTDFGSGGTWLLTPGDSTVGTLHYNSSGPEFDYSFSATGLTPSTAYSLIYYADKPARFEDWGGDNPGVLIATFTAGESGNITPTADSVELVMDLPCSPDANISEYDYSGPPDNYDHAHGAKIWLVPSSDYTEPALTAWNPSQYLFETDLVTYTDTGVIVPANDTASTATDNTTITATAGSGGPATVEVTEYTAPPAEGPVFGALGTYVDVHCDTPENLTEVIIHVDYDATGMTDAEELAQRIYYWNSTDSAWRECSDQSVNTGSNYIEATITALTTPTLSYLATSIFGAGSVTLELDDWYKSGDTVDVTIEDAGQSGVIAAFAWSDTVGVDGKITFALSETDPGVFEGSFDLVSTTPGAGELLVNDGDVISVAYDYGEAELLVGTATVDGTAPVFALVDPVVADEEYYKNGDIITLTVDLDAAGYTVTADFSDIDSEYTAGAETVMDESDNTYTITYAIDTDNTIADGEYTISVTAEDDAGNTADDDSCSVNLDNTEPAVTDPAADPVVIQPDEATDVTFTATVTDDGSGMSETATPVTIDLSDPAIGGSATQEMTDTGDGVYEYDWDDLSVTDEGTYYLVITATDNVSNVNATANITLRVIADTIDPVFTSTEVFYPIGYESARPQEPVKIFAVVTDALSGVDTVTVDATDIGLTDSEALALVAGTTDVYRTDLQVQAGTTPGTKTLTITAADYATNDATANVSVVVVSELTAYNIWLNDGWNLISLPLMSSDNCSTVLDGLWCPADEEMIPDILSVWGYDPVDGWQSYVPGGPPPTLTRMTDGCGYWIDVEYAADAPDAFLTIHGTQQPVPPALPPTYDVVTGWNLIGFKVSYPIKAQTYLAGITDSVVRIYGFWNGAYYIVQLGLDEDIQPMNPGSGYWLAVTEPGTIYP